MALGSADTAESLYDIVGTASPSPSHASDGQGEVERLCVLAPPREKRGSIEDTAETPEPIRPNPRAFRVAPSARPVGTFVATGKWEGVVESVSDKEGSFDARLTDILGDDGELCMTFQKDDVSREDEELLCPGAIFYWIVGYYDRVSGQRTRLAELKFRRLPVRRLRDLERAREKAIATLRELGL